MRPRAQEAPLPPASSLVFKVKASPLLTRDGCYHPEHELTHIVEGEGRRRELRGARRLAPGQVNAPERSPATAPGPPPRPGPDRQRGRGAAHPRAPR